MSESLLACEVSAEGEMVSMVFVGETKVQVLVTHEAAVEMATELLCAAKDLREARSAEAEPARVLRLVPKVDG